MLNWFKRSATHSPIIPRTSDIAASYTRYYAMNYVFIYVCKLYWHFLVRCLCFSLQCSFDVFQAFGALAIYKWAHVILKTLRILGSMLETVNYNKIETRCSIVFMGNAMLFLSSCFYEHEKKSVVVVELSNCRPPSFSSVSLDILGVFVCDPQPNAHFHNFRLNDRDLRQNKHVYYIEKQRLILCLPSLVWLHKSSVLFFFSTDDDSV